MTTQPSQVTAAIGPAWIAFREGLGLSRQQAATLMQISEEGLRRIELGLHIPRGDTLMRAAFLYRCTVDELLPVDYAALMDERWLELLGRRSAQSLPQDATANAADVVPLKGKGGKGRSSTRSTAAASTTQPAASGRGASGSLTSEQAAVGPSAKAGADKQTKRSARGTQMSKCEHTTSDLAA